MKILKKFIVVIYILFVFGLICNTNDSYFPWANLAGVWIAFLSFLIARGFKWQE